MKAADSKSKVVEILDKIIKTENRKLDALFTRELIEKNKMRTSEVKSVLGLRTDLNELPVEKLVYLYSAILLIKKNIPKIDEFFTEQEIRYAENLRTERIKSVFPIKIKAHKQSNKEDYLINASIKQLIEWQDADVFKVDANMARESVITNYNGQLISHVSYSDKRAREVGEDTAVNNFYSNGIRLHLINDGTQNYEFIQSLNSEEEGEGLLVIKSGNIALLDGNHRVQGFEYALLENPDLYQYTAIFFTVGSVKDGQYIIDQEEKREPLKKELVKTFSSASEAQIIRDLKTEDIDSVYKFCNTLQEIHQGGGFVLNGVLIDNIEEFYNIESKSQEVKTRKWIVEFLNELADVFHKDFENYLVTKKTKWNVSPYSFGGYIYLSSVLQNQANWEDKLLSIFSQVDFSNENKPWKDGASKPDKLVVKYFKEVTGSVLG